MEMQELLHELENIGFTGVDLLSNLWSSVVGIVSYVLMSLGMYTIAKRRNINHPWLAWVPFGSSWLLGCISDQYHYVVEEEEKSKRKWMLALDILTSVLLIAGFVALIAGVVNAFVGMDMGSGYVMEDEAYMEAVLSPMLGSLGIMLLALIPAIALAIMRIIAMYDLFASCDPNRKVVYLVLSILFDIAGSICVFISRHKDDGMPARIVATPEQDTWDAPAHEWQPPQTTEEPWDI